MTAPIVHGFPDWGRYVARATKGYINDAPVAQIVPFAYPPVLVSDTDHLEVFFIPGAAGRLSIDFYMDEALTQFIDGHTIDCDTNVLFSRPVNVLGPWCQFVVEGAASPLGYELKVTMCPTPFQAYGDTVDRCILFNARALNFAAGFTVLTAPFVTPGEAYMQAMFPGRASELRVEGLDMLGNLYLLADMQGNGTQPSLRLFLPPMTIQLTVANYGAGPAAYWFTMVARPGMPGS